ncbi:IclR family transcriptional regulator domain-containing protein [Skermanella pratensis]|uniref:IclR family transcriptional regulator domain-containing protein n=1 Tax=Skermanella pratensis TaxID=2233999 RepID=UPI001FE8EA7D|nr:IclR family transcriptional regulator C-terminal domain-containing protein [Skermanella pratensis]
MDGDHGQQGARAEAAGPVQALSRSLDLLECIAAAGDGVGSAELAALTGQPPSTAHRLLKNLEQRGYVAFDEDRGRWFIGVQAFTVGGAFLRRRNHALIARPVMRRLMEESGETVNLAVEDKGEAVILTQVECRKMMRALSQPGTRAPLYCSGVGKALLAALPEEEALAVLKSLPLRRITDRTLTGPDELARDLAATRKRGFAIDDEEHSVGLRCVAAAVHDEHGRPLCALSISGPAVRIPDGRIAELGVLVGRAAGEITRAVGGAVPQRRD